MKRIISLILLTLSVSLFADQWRGIAVTDEKASGVSVPAPIVGLEYRPILHQNVCEKTEIKEVVKNWLK